MTCCKVPGRTAGSTYREKLLAQIDPDADEQRFYCCDGCGWPCINPIGTVPERRGLCVDCVVEDRVSSRQATLTDF